MKLSKWKQSFGFLAVTEVSIAAQLLFFLPPVTRAATPTPPPVSGEPLAVYKQEAPAEQQEVTVNKTVPDVTPPPQYPSFSPVPTDAELTKARVFGEPLIPEAGEANDAENQALAQAITTYLTGGDSEALEPLEGVVTTFPKSRWRVAIQANVGSWYRRKGYFTRAQRNLNEAWRLGRRSDTEGVQKLAEFAAGELMVIHMQFGQVDPLEALVADFAGRELTGGITEKLSAARATVWGLRNDHEKAIPSVSVALERVRKDKHDKAEKEKKRRNPNRKKEHFKRNARLDAFPATHAGASLADAADLADLTDLRLQMARRVDVNAEVPVPAVVHLKQGHFAALVEVRDGRYRLDDPLLGGEVWFSKEAFDEETSGFFLLERGATSGGWRRARRNEAEPIRGKCVYATGDTNDTGEEDDKEGERDDEEDDKEGERDDEERDGEGEGGGPGPCGLCTYSFHTMLASLHVYDTPLGYSPPVGPGVYFKVTYNQREATQPTIFTFSNLGKRWTFGWLSYIEDDPTNVGAPIEHYQRGGGRESYQGFINGVSAPSEEVRAVMKIVSTDPIVYERHLRNGAVEVFSESDGAASTPRRIFMSARKDSAGSALTLTYDGQLRLVSVTDALGQVTTLSYELGSDPLKITKVTDPFGRFATLDYDDEGQLIRITDVIGMISELEYGRTIAYQTVTNDFVRALTTPYGTTTFRNGNGPYNVVTNRWVEATDPLGGTHRVELLLNNAPVASSDPSADVPTGFSGNSNLNTHLSVYYSKLAMDRATTDPPDPTKGKIVRWRSSSYYKMSGYHKQSVKRTLENRVWFGHAGEPLLNGVGATGRPTMVGRVLDDGTSQIYLYEHNMVGKVIRYTNPVGRERVYVYGTETTPDSDPTIGTGIDLLEVNHKNGTSYETLVELTFNTQHRPLTLTDALGNIYTNTYDAQGQLLTATTPATTEAPTGATTTLTYDEDGYLLSLSGPAVGSTTSLTYDSFGRALTVSPPLQDTVTLAYDALNRLTKVTYSDSTYEETVYRRLDAERVRDRLGRWTQTTFDALGRPAARVDPSGRTLSFQWCACGALDALIDANGNRTSWERDDQGRVTVETRADDSEYTYTYESSISRLKTLSDPKTVVTTLEYFIDSRLKKKSYSDTTPDATFTYDYRGRLATAANGTDTLSWTYDSNNQTLSESSTKNSSTVSYEYDAVGNRRTLSLDSTPFSTYGYDTALRLTSIARNADVFDFEYDAASRRTKMSYPNGISTTYEYDAESRVERITAKLGASVVTDFQYSYNAVGNRTQKQTPDLTETYSYDRSDQLEEVVRTGTGADRWHYAYDPSGNRTTEQIGDAPMQASYDNMNRLISTSAGGKLAFKGSLDEPGTVTVAGEPSEVDSTDAFRRSVAATSGTNTVAVVATDPSGNTRTNTYNVSVSGTGKAFSYDGNGNLSQKVEGADTWTYEWDAENRLTKALKNAVAVATFAYDPLGRRSEKISGGITKTFTYVFEDVLREIAGATTTYYVHGPEVDEPLTRESGSTISHYHSDALGSIVKTTDAAGAAAHTYRYGPFGTIEDGGSQGGYAFTGRWWDPATSLYYYRARYYDPQIGRFLNEDPIRLLGGLNLFRYVENNPTNLTDAFGLSSEQGAIGTWFSGLLSTLTGAVTEVATHSEAAGVVAKTGVAAAEGANALAEGLLAIEAQRRAQIESLNPKWRDSKAPPPRPGTYDPLNPPDPPDMPPSIACPP